MSDRLPLEPLIRMVGSQEQVAIMLGYESAKHMNRHTNWARMVKNGVSWQRADELACGCNLHPLEVWGDAWLEAQGAQLGRTKPVRRSPRWGLISAEVKRMERVA